jgi:hypothetical protein
MKNRIFKKCAYVSMSLFLGFIGLYAYALLAPNPRADDSGIHWSYSSLGNLHVAVTSNWGGHLVFFNQTMPYTGSIMSFAGDKSVIEHGLTGWGLYFRSIEHADTNETWRTFMISLWYPIIAFAILPALGLVQKLRGHRCATHSEA